jgi:nucleoporin NDC1
MVSAWLFSEVHGWSASKGADLSRIKYIPRTDRPMLNERPIYMSAFFFFLAVFQSGWHLFYDYDRLDMPVTKTKPLGSPNQLSHILVPPLAQLKSNLPAMMVSCFKRSICVSVAAPFIYSTNLLYLWSIRSLTWSFTRTWAKLFWNLPKSSSLPSIGPYHWSIIVRSIISGFLLLFLWDVGNAAFSAYVAQEPLRNDRPVTYTSKDPNGSLLTGLRGKRLLTRVRTSTIFIGRFLTATRHLLCGNFYTLRNDWKNGEEVYLKKSTELVVAHGLRSSVYV